jgi:hypothetical protein
MTRIRVSFLVLGFLSLNISGAAVNPFRRPWCEGWLQREPSEISFLKTELERSPDRGKLEEAWNSKDAYSLYPGWATHNLMGVLNQPRTHGLGLEVRSRMISYGLLQWLKIPKYQDILIKHIAQFLETEIATHPYSARDLQRLRMTFHLFLGRNPTWATRSGGGSMVMLSTFVASIPDIMLSGMLHEPLTALVAHWVPGIEFVPVPVVLGFVVSRNVYLNFFGNRLTPEQQVVVSALDAKFAAQIMNRVNVQDMDQNWRAGFKILLDEKNRSLKTPGTLRAAVDTYSAIFLARPREKNEILKLLKRWSADLVRISPVDAQEIIESFQAFKKVAEKIGITEAEFAPVIANLKKCAAGWIGNEEARFAAEALVSAHYGRQELPAQTGDFVFFV